MKSKESGKLKNKGNLNELVDAQEAIKRNEYKKPRPYTRRNAIPTDQDKKIVYSYAAYGATNEDIAAILGMDNKTLTKRFPEELISGRATAKNTIAQRLYVIAIGKDAVIHPDTNQVIAAAIKPNLSALIFLAKTRLGWKETAVLEQNVQVQSPGVQIYLPDNGMRCEGDNE